jgi:L,D-transpeptidase YcbB
MSAILLMLRGPALLPCLLLLALAACGVRSRPEPKPAWSELAGRAIRARIRGSLASPRLELGGPSRSTSPQLSRFYLHRSERPAWCSPRGPTAHADDLLTALGQVEGDGLDPQAYGLAELQQRVTEWRAGKVGRQGEAMTYLAEVDLLLTNAFLCCAADLQRGRIPPQRVHSSWQARPVRANLSGLLQTALDLGRVGSTLLGLRPPQPGYAQLRRMLGRYRGLERAGPWPLVRPGRAQAKALEQRLTASGDLPGEEAGGHGSPGVAAALARFQRRHGLEASGQVDSLTRAALNVPVSARIAQIQVNMERWRWLPHDPGARYVLVRLADFELDAVSGGRVVLRLRVIVGRPFWRTPIFSSSMTRVELNPPWYIPRSIAVQEILPRVQQDSTYLKQRQIDLAVGAGDTARVVDADPINWLEQTAENFAFLLRQRPGPANPLGRVKMFFANPHDVYLHATPNSELFDLPVRDLSHGCIRVERSLELAAFVLGTDWPAERLEQAAAAGAYQLIPVEPSVPVYLLYWTAWVDAMGELQLRDDWYDADRSLYRALRSVSRLP